MLILYFPNFSVAEEEYEGDSKQTREDHSAPAFEDDSLFAADTDSIQPLQLTLPSIKVSCNYGSNDCPENEVCSPFRKSRRQGICKCRDGFERNTQRLCQPVGGTTINDMVNDSNDDIVVTEILSNAFKPPDQATATNLTQPTTGSQDSAVTKLVVSAGLPQVCFDTKRSMSIKLYV